MTVGGASSRVCRQSTPRRKELNERRIESPGAFEIWHVPNSIEPDELRALEEIAHALGVLARRERVLTSDDDERRHFKLASVSSYDGRSDRPRSAAAAPSGLVACIIALTCSATAGFVSILRGASICGSTPSAYSPIPSRTRRSAIALRFRLPSSVSLRKRGGQHESAHSVWICRANSIAICPPIDSPPMTTSAMSR